MARGPKAPLVFEIQRRSVMASPPLPRAPWNKSSDSGAILKWCDYRANNPPRRGRMFCLQPPSWWKRQTPPTRPGRTGGQDPSRTQRVGAHPAQPSNLEVDRLTPQVPSAQAPQAEGPTPRNPVAMTVAALPTQRKPLRILSICFGSSYICLGPPIGVEAWWPRPT